MTCYYQTDIILPELNTFELIEKNTQDGGKVKVDLTQWVRGEQCILPCHLSILTHWTLCIYWFRHSSFFFSICFGFIFCIFGTFASCNIELYIFCDWNKESWLCLILISTLSPSIGPFYEHCKRGRRGHIVPPSIGYSISQYDYGPCESQEGGEREVIDVAVKDSCYV